jgi:hypothetical protein
VHRNSRTASPWHHLISIRFLAAKWFIFCVVFCQSSFVFYYFLFRSLCCVCFLDIRLFDYSFGISKSGCHISTKKRQCMNQKIMRSRPRPQPQIENFRWDENEFRFVLNQHAELEFYSATSLKQQSAGRHVATLGHITLIPSQPVFPISP